ncbi:MAG: phosphoribosylglycinamide formyltransferase [Bacteroidota bacterium]
MIPQKFNVAILASGNGTNAEAIIKYFLGHQSIAVTLLLSNNPDAKALQRAENLDVPINVFDNEQFTNGAEIKKWLAESKVTHIVLAGFLRLIPDYLLKAYPVINIHPSLLPKFGGKGMYGKKVHEAVRIAGEIKTGITIHEVNDRFDEGKILFQVTTVLDSSDNAESIAEKVHALEYKYYPGIIEKWILSKNLTISG